MGGNDELHASIGELIRLARRRANLSQEELARRVDLTRTSISNIERGEQRVLVDTIYALALALGTSAHDLLPASLPRPAAGANSQLNIDDLQPDEQEWVERIRAE